MKGNGESKLYRYRLVIFFIVIYTILVSLYPISQSLNRFIELHSLFPQWEEALKIFHEWLLSKNGRFIITWLEVILILTIGVSFLVVTFGKEKIITNDESCDLSIKGLLKSPGFYLVSFFIFFYLPTLGTKGLWDPWETHYGEVARRMVERNDWISTWWENSWFYSKPILIFWLEALIISLGGFEILPDQVSPNIEWAIRFPTFFFSIITLLVIYLTISKIFNKNIGFFAAFILGTMAQYYFLTHQAMTDILFIGPMSCGLCFLILAAIEDDSSEIKEIKFRLTSNRVVILNLKFLLIFLIIITGLPQYIYISTRPLWFEEGSLGQGNIRITYPVYRIPGIVQGIVWFIPWMLLLHSITNEKRIRRVYLLCFYFMGGLATLAKGVAGLGLPLLIAAVYLIMSWDWKQLRSGELKRGLTLFFTISAPWYINMYLRHGEAFINRLFVHDHINRLIVGVHGDTGTIGYFIQQLGYGTFPWIILLPGGIIGWWVYLKESSDAKKRKALVFIFSWFFITFTFFTGMITKFHHYIAPALPPLAILGAIFLNSHLESNGLQKKYGVLLLICGTVLLGVISRDLGWIPSSGIKGYERLIHLFVYNYTRPYPEFPQYNYAPELTWFSITFLIISILFLFKKTKRYSILIWIIVTLIFAGWALHYYMYMLSDHWSQKKLIALYYKLRKSRAEKLVAFQMNWKGENFYTGNRAVIQMSLNTQGLEIWLRKHKGERHFFITEPHRIVRLKHIINNIIPGAGEKLVTVSPPELCNKFRLLMGDLR